MSKRRGFTLIELLIVVAIIGIVVAISVVNMINAIQRAKQKRSMGDMKTVATAIEAYATDQNFYPAAAGFSLPSGLVLPTGTLGTIRDSLSPTYLRIVPLVDGWSSYFTYGTSPARSDFALCSGGADGALDPADEASVNYNKEFWYALSDADRQVMRLVDEALRGIKNGTFGECSHCGKPIQRKRLEAVPWARHCVDCQDLQDRGQIE